MDIESEITDLITAYNELNPTSVTELESEPSPLEFMRFVARNTPFVVRGGASSWKAVQKWDSKYLLDAMKGQQVNVAVTPYGNADSPTQTAAYGTVFAKPHEELQSFETFLKYIVDQEREPSFPKDAEIRYAQTQNDNLREEYSLLYPDTLQDIPFARIALQRSPEAINLWLGNSRTVTAVHKDNFENIYVQVRGRKHFTLLPPVCHPCMQEQQLAPATYVRQSGALVLCMDEQAEPVPFCTWDPDLKDSTHLFSRLAKPQKVVLDPGDMLYLPAMWYHKVAQSVIPEDPDGMVVAVNYWYDMDFSGPLYPFASFLRNFKSSRQESDEPTKNDAI
ncbi:hypothetical protein Golomagni_06821 [Golovinomyces magnicellulatus]|nr:hypothetical protein Golomagni_06821 [Golovinomyces magnicellulatus]